MGSTYQSPSLLSVQNVTKRYGGLTAVNDMSLDIVPGEIFALLGPNGAGKTTLIGCICGMITRFDGNITVAGFDVRDDYRLTRRLIGLVPQELNYDSAFTVRDVLEYQGGYFSAPPTPDKVNEMLERFSLADKADRNTRGLSGGMKRRLMIAKALMHDPVLLFLDEPTAGVDVELREELWEFVRDLRDRGTTIVLTTHYIEEAEALADRVGIVNFGNLLRVAPREVLMESLGHRSVEVRLHEAIPADFIAQMDALNLEKAGPKTLMLHIDRSEEDAPGPGPTDRLLRALFDAGLSIERVDGHQTSLESIFRQIIEQDNSKTPDAPQIHPSPEAP